MRINVKKCFFVGSEKVKNEFFIKSQQVGVIEFFGNHKQSNFSEEMFSLFEAIKILKKLEEIVGSSEKKISLPYSLFILVDKVIKNKKRIEELEAEAKTLDKDIARMLPLGEFTFIEIEKLEHDLKKSLRFFSCKQLSSSPSEIPSNCIHIASAYRHDYFLVIGSEREIPKNFSEIKVYASASELREKQRKIKQEIASLKAELKDFIPYQEDLKREFSLLYSNYALKEGIAQAEPVLKNRLFFVYGWVPEDKLVEVKSLAEQENVYIDETEIHVDEKVPTYLENKGLSRLGEDLVDIYDTPSSTDKDPSGWVFGFFALFFSMIVNDAGYGLVFLLTTAFLYLRLRKKTSVLGSGMRRFLSLTGILGFTCVLWGICNSSFFGMSFPANNVFEKCSVLQFASKEKAKYYLRHKPQAYKELLKDKPELAKVSSPEAFLDVISPKVSPDQESVPYNGFKENIFMELSLFIGAVHLIIALLRYLRMNYAGFGWILFIIGGYLFFPTYLHSISLIHYLFHVPYHLGGQLGVYFIGSGIISAVILSIIQKKWGGIGEISQIVQVFSDVLSYLRIYALALAGAMMATTFNNISTRLPLSLGIVILIFGHAINIVLAIMGGVIHGLRLNFIEWYHYSFDGGGRKFKPLSKINY